MSKGRRQMPQQQQPVLQQPSGSTTEGRAKDQYEMLLRQRENLGRERKRLLTHQAEIAEGLNLVTANLTAVEGALLTLEFVLGIQQAPASASAPPQTPPAPAETPIASPASG